MLFVDVMSVSFYGWCIKSWIHINSWISWYITLPDHYCNRWGFSSANRPFLMKYFQYNFWFCQSWLKTQWLPMELIHTVIKLFKSEGWEYTQESTLCVSGMKCMEIWYCKIFQCNEIGMSRIPDQHVCEECSKH